MIWYYYENIDWIYFNYVLLHKKNFKNIRKCLTIVEYFKYCYIFVFLKVKLFIFSVLVSGRNVLLGSSFIQSLRLQNSWILPKVIYWKSLFKICILSNNWKFGYKNVNFQLCHYVYGSILVKNLENLHKSLHHHIWSPIFCLDGMVIIDEMNRHSINWTEWSMCSFLSNVTATFLFIT